MLETRPEIHGNGAELHLNLHHPFLIVQIDRCLHDKVKAPVAILLGVLYVILLLEQGNVILGQQIAAQKVNIIGKGTDYPYAGDIMQLFFNNPCAEG